MQLLPRGYTNKAHRHGDLVTKTYQGPAAPRRLACEARTVQALQGLLPVPGWVSSTEEQSTFTFREGVHGQDLMAAGRAEDVLRACGQTLRTLHAVDPAVVFADAVPGDGQTVVHGDYGPNNVLLDPSGLRITAVLDWEWAHPGNPLEDVAWCEWIVRTHHAEDHDAVDAFFDGYGSRPGWSERQHFMVTRLEELVAF